MRRLVLGLLLLKKLHKTEIAFGTRLRAKNTSFCDTWNSITKWSFLTCIQWIITQNDTWSFVILWATSRFMMRQVKTSAIQMTSSVSRWILNTRKISALALINQNSYYSKEGKNSKQKMFNNTCPMKSSVLAVNRQLKAKQKMKWLRKRPISM